MDTQPRVTDVAALVVYFSVLVVYVSVAVVFVSVMGELRFGYGVFVSVLNDDSAFHCDSAVMCMYMDTSLKS
jgi:hypothetical protein